MKSCKAEFLTLQVVLLATLIDVTTAATQCKNELGNAVDWFILYKLPNGAQPRPTATIVPTGEIFYFMDSNRHQTWTLSAASITGQNQPLFTTLQQVYSQAYAGMYLMYNDQPPVGNSNSNRAHAKGVVAFDTISGFWLVHSAPHFPAVRASNYQYPQNAVNFGQIFLCVSFNTPRNLDIIVKQMRVNRVQIYDHNNPQIFPATMNAELQDLFNNIPITFPIQDNHNIENLDSIGMIDFISFAKNANFGTDLYDTLVAPNLMSHLAVESWKRGSGLGPSGLTYKVYNIDAVKLPSRNVGSYFLYTVDHSKFAVSISPAKHYVCIGDINRMDTQANRGGGALCFENQQVANAFRSAVYYTVPIG